MDSSNLFWLFFMFVMMQPVISRRLLRDSSRSMTNNRLIREWFRGIRQRILFLKGGRRVQGCQIPD